MSAATAVLNPGVPVTLAPAGNISFEIEAGQRLRLTQPEGEQVADFISFNRDDVRELLSMHSSRAVNLNWKLTAPNVLYSNRTREMWQIEDDLTGENYCGGGIVRPISKPPFAATAWTGGISISMRASTCS
jgi:uncharacterized protein YcgI (DUF1989 family)